MNVKVKGTQHERFVCETLVPVVPLKHGFYHCDKRFKVDELEPYFQSHSDVGVVLISGEQTDLYRVAGTRYDLVDRITVHRQKRQKKGGQSAHRFQFIRLEQIQQYVKKIAERMNSCFFDGTCGKLTVEHVLVGGMGDVKSQVLSSPHLLKKVSEAIQANVTITDLSIAKFMMSCRDDVKLAANRKDAEHLERFYTLLRTQPQLVVYGTSTVAKYLAEYMLKELLIAAECEPEWKERTVHAQETGCTVRVLQGTDTNFRDGFGGVVGVLWHAASDEVREALEEQ